VPQEKDRAGKKEMNEFEKLEARRDKLEGRMNEVSDTIKDYDFLLKGCVPMKVDSLGITWNGKWIAVKAHGRKLLEQPLMERIKHLDELPKLAEKVITATEKELPE